MPTAGSSWEVLGPFFWGGGGGGRSEPRGQVSTVRSQSCSSALKSLFGNLESNGLESNALESNGLGFRV